MADDGITFDPVEVPIPDNLKGRGIVPVWQDRDGAWYAPDPEKDGVGRALDTSKLPPNFNKLPDSEQSNLLNQLATDQASDVSEHKAVDQAVQQGLQVGPGGQTSKMRAAQPGENVQQVEKLNSGQSLQELPQGNSATDPIAGIINGQQPGSTDGNTQGLGGDSGVTFDPAPESEHPSGVTFTPSDERGPLRQSLDAAYNALPTSPGRYIYDLWNRAKPFAEEQLRNEDPYGGGFQGESTLPISVQPDPGERYATINKIVQSGEWADVPKQIWNIGYYDMRVAGDVMQRTFDTLAAQGAGMIAQGVGDATSLLPQPPDYVNAPKDFQDWLGNQYNMFLVQSNPQVLTKDLVAMAQYAGYDPALAAQAAGRQALNRNIEENLKPQDPTPGAPVKPRVSIDQGGKVTPQTENAVEISADANANRVLDQSAAQTAAEKNAPKGLGTGQETTAKGFGKPRVRVPADTTEVPEITPPGPDGSPPLASAPLSPATLEDWSKRVMSDPTYKGPGAVNDLDNLLAAQQAEKQGVKRPAVGEPAVVNTTPNPDAAAPGPTLTPPGDAAPQAGFPAELSRDPNTSLFVEPPKSNPQPLPPDDVPRAAFAGNLNLNRIDAPEGAKDMMIQNAEAIRVEREAQGLSGYQDVLSDEQLVENARLFGMTPRKFVKMIKDTQMLPERMLAARQMFVEQGTLSWNLSKQAVLSGLPEDVNDAVEAVLRLITMQDGIKGVTSNAGRTLRQFRITVGKDASVGAAAKGPLPQDAYKTLTKLLDGRSPHEIVEAMARMESPEALTAAAARGFVTTNWQRFMEVWMNWGLLSGPSTHAVNAISNTLVALNSIPERAIAAGISKIIGGDIQFGEAGQRIVGTFEGLKEGLPSAIRAFITEMPSDKWLASTAAADKVSEAGHMHAFGGMTGRAVRIPTGLLTASDEVFKHVAYRQELNSLALREAQRNWKGLSKAEQDALIGTHGSKEAVLATDMADIRANPPERIENAAIKAASYQTFTNKLGPMSSKISGIVNHDAPVLRVIVPFVRTPTNILKYGWERTPFQGVNEFFRAENSALKGHLGKNAQAEAIAKMGWGSAIGGTVIYMAKQGLISGGGPADKAKRATLYESGWQPYSIKIGDGWHAYSRLEPIGTLFGMASDLSEASDAMTNDQLGNVATLITASIMKNLANKTWLQGLSSTMEAFNDPNRYGANVLAKLAGSMIPGMVAQYARSEDPFLRDAKTVMDGIKSRIPGWRETLPKKNGIFGDPILRDADGPNLLSPFYYSAAKNDPTINESLRLGVYAGAPDRKLEGVDLTPPEYELWTHLSGKAVKSAWDAVVKSPGWPTIPDGQKKVILEDLEKQARGTARDQFEINAIQVHSDFLQRKFEAIKVRAGLAPAAQKLEGAGQSNMGKIDGIVGFAQRRGLSYTPSGRMPTAQVEDRTGQKDPLVQRDVSDLDRAASELQASGYNPETDR